MSSPKTITRHEIPWGFKEMAYIFSSLARGIEPSETRELEKGVNVLVCAKYSVTVPSCSAGIKWSIEALTEPGSPVGIPRFAHPDLPKLVHAAGRIPVTVDTDPATRIVTASTVHKAVEQHKIEAVVVAHLHGKPCDVKSIREAAPGLAIIGDGAHALGAGKGENKVGGIEDACSFSFRLGKPIVCGTGGIVTTSNKGVHDFIQKKMEHADDMTISEAVRNIVSVLLNLVAVRTPAYRHAVLPLFKFMDKVVPGVLDEYWTGRIGTVQGSPTKPVALHPLLSGLARLQLDTLQARVSRQIANARLLAARCGSSRSMELPEIRDDGCTYLGFPVRSRKAMEAVRILRRSGVDSRLDYIVDLSSPAGRPDVFLPPNHFRLGLQEMEFVARALNSLDHSFERHGV